MKFLKSLGIILLSVLIVSSCQKEYSEEGGSTATALGTLKEDASGECLPSSVAGIFTAGTALNTTNKITVTVNFTTVGTYLISTDTVNGYFFRGAGVVAATGDQQVVLTGVGTPGTAGNNTFTVRYGTSNCNLVVGVLASGAGAAVFTPGGSPTTCATATLAGTYTAGTALTASNTVTIGVTVTTPGTYNITIPAVNGISFSGTGSLAATGPQDITLVASGTPTAAGPFNYVINGSAGSSCTFSVTTAPGGGSAAVYTLGGAPASCSGFVLAGTYQAGLATGATNTAKFNVTVTTVGTYSITTTAVNGVTFSGSGTFTTTGAQLVTLTASGTPAAAGPFNYPATGLGSTCSFSVTYTTASAAAVFTMVGAGSTCSPGTVAGTYTAGTVLGAGNTVTVQVNVATAGSYTLTSNTVNGMTFSATGVFSATGTQSVVLTGTGTPAAAGTNVFSVGATSCTFSVTVVGTATDYITAKVDGVYTTFNFNLDALIDNSQGFPILDIYGEQNAAATEPSMELGIAKATGAITAGTYTVNQFATGVLVFGSYFNAAGTEFSALTDVNGATQTPAFTIVITSITATRVTGTFTGPLKQDGVGPAVRTITEGTFSLPLP